MTDRSKPLALEAETRSKLIAQITSTPGWVLPEPQAAVSIETAVAFAIAFADAEIERAAEAVEAIAAEKRASMRPAGHPMAGGMVDGILENQAAVADYAAAAIRALPTTGEVGRG